MLLRSSFIVIIIIIINQINNTKLTERLAELYYGENCRHCPVNEVLKLSLVTAQICMWYNAAIVGRRALTRS